MYILYGVRNFQLNILEFVSTRNKFLGINPSGIGRIYTFVPKALIWITTNHLLKIIAFVFILLANLSLYLNGS